MSWWKIAQIPSSSLRAQSDLSHCCHERCDFSFSRLDGSHLCGIHSLAVSSAVWICVCYWSFWNVTRDRLRFCQRSDPLVIIEHFCCGSCFFLQEHQLRIKQETTIHWEIARGPLDCQDVKNSAFLPAPISTEDGPHFQL